MRRPWVRSSYALATLRIRAISGMGCPSSRSCRNGTLLAEIAPITPALAPDRHIADELLEVGVRAAR